MFRGETGKALRLARLLGLSPERPDQHEMESLSTTNKPIDQMEETILYAREWVKMMWDMDVISHDAFDNLEDAQESLVAYLEGREHPSHDFATKQ
jgi:hypothetical protein